MPSAYSLPSMQDTRGFQQYDPSAALAQRQIGSSAFGAVMPNNPYRQQAQQAVLENVNSYLTSPQAGYTRNGIPHNNPRVIAAYMKNIKDQLGRFGKKVEIAGTEMAPDGTTILLNFLDDKGQKLGYAMRTFTPEGVTANMLANTGKGKMGVMPALYPAEGQFMNQYGGQIEGNFIHPKTHQGFGTSHPTATGAGDGTGYRMANYLGMMDFK